MIPTDTALYPTLEPVYEVNPVSILISLIPVYWVFVRETRESVDMVERKMRNYFNVGSEIGSTFEYHTLEEGVIIQNIWFVEFGNDDEMRRLLPFSSTFYGAYLNEEDTISIPDSISKSYYINQWIHPYVLDKLKYRLYRNTIPWSRVKGGCRVQFKFTDKVADFDTTARFRLMDFPNSVRGFDFVESNVFGPHNVELVTTDPTDIENTLFLLFDSGAAELKEGLAIFDSGGDDGEPRNPFRF